jgi:outer membrane protein assembly factor BamB
MDKNFSRSAGWMVWGLFLVGMSLGSLWGVGFAGEWPGWRGADRDGVVRGGAVWPEGLGEDELRRAWRVELGESYSGPVTGGGLVFSTESMEGDREAAVAFDAASGEVRWRAEWEGAMRVPFFARSNGSWIRSTPAYDAASGSLLVAGMRDLLVCLDAATGGERWRLDFVERFGAPLPAFGFVSSPLVVDGSVVVQAGAGVVRVRLSDGEVMWRGFEDKGGMNGSAFSSPMVAELAGRRQLLVQGRDLLGGLDLEDGSVMWSQAVPAFRGMNIVTPLVWGEGVFTAGYRNGARYYRVGASAEGLGAEQLWELKASGYMCSPVEVGGHAYLHLQNQKMACIDLATGELRWESGEKFGKYVSLVAQGERILGLDERGELLLMAADPEGFRLLARRSVSEQECWGHVAVAGGRVYVRELRGLSAWDWGGQ